MAYPTNKTNAQDNTTEIVAAHLNNLEDYVGITGSADSASLTYKLGNTTGGHDHDGSDSKLLGSMYKFVPGMGMIWWGTIASVPSLWAFANGASLLRATYSELFTNIGTIHGAADGTHFNLPDARDKFIIGAYQDDSGVPKTNVTGSLLQSGGAATINIAHTHGGATASHTLILSEIPEHDHGGGVHSHGVTDPGHVHSAWVAWGSSTGSNRRYETGSGNLLGTETFSANVNSNTTGLTVNNSAAIITAEGGGGGHTHDISSSLSATQSILPPFIAAVPIIFTGV